MGAVWRNNCLFVCEGASRKTGLSCVKSQFLAQVYLLYPQNISSFRRTAILQSLKGEISIILSIQNLKCLKMIHQSKSYTDVFLHEFIWRIIFLFHITFRLFVQAYHIAVFCFMTPCSLAGGYQPYGAVYSPQTLCLVNICTAWSRHAFSCIMNTLETTYYHRPHCTFLLSAGKWSDDNWMKCGNRVVVFCVVWLIVHVHVTLTVGIERSWFVRCGF